MDVARALLRVARPGAQFPDVRRLDAHLSLLGPRGSRGVHRQLELDPISGLPALGALLAVRAEREVARDARSRNEPAPRAKAAYYDALVEADLLPVSDVEVRVRRRERGSVHLEVVHDRIDAASGLPLRYTLRLAQRGTRHVAVEDDAYARPHQAFLNLMERHSGADAEVTFLLVSDLPGVTVEEIVRGQIGPLHFAGIDAPEPLAGVVEGVPGSFVLHLAVERAARDVAEDRCRDPFTRLYRHTLSPQARQPIEQRRQALGYRVAKERRLVCTPNAEAALKAALARQGTPLVVRCA